MTAASTMTLNGLINGMLTMRTPGRPARLLIANTTAVRHLAQHRLVEIQVIAKRIHARRRLAARTGSSEQARKRSHTRLKALAACSLHCR